MLGHMLPYVYNFLVVIESFLYFQLGLFTNSPSLRTICSPESIVVPFSSPSKACFNDSLSVFNSVSFVDTSGTFVDTSGVNTGWDVDGVVNATQNHTMTRKPDVCGGNIGDWSLSDGSSVPSEWIIGVIDDFSDLNTHTSDCVSSTSVETLDPLKRELLEVVDVLGRKIKYYTNQPLFYIYNDGTVEKKIIIE